MKIIVIPAFLIFLSFSGTFGQDSRVFTTPDLVWCGLDYSRARFIGSSHFDPDLLHRHFVSWNDLMLLESEKYNFKEVYQKENQIVDLSVVTRRNELVEPDKALIDEQYKIEVSELHEIISDYNLKVKEGLGLVYVVESLNKNIQHASIYVVFFDIAEKKILWATRYNAPAAGFGTRNYWARPVYEIVKASRSTYKKAARRSARKKG